MEIRPNDIFDRYAPGIETTAASGSVPLAGTQDAECDRGTGDDVKQGRYAKYGIAKPRHITIRCSVIRDDVAEDSGHKDKRE